MKFSRRMSAIGASIIGLIAFGLTAPAQAGMFQTGEAYAILLNCSIDDPILSVSDNCFVFHFDSNSETMTNGYASVILPKGISVTKRMSLGTNYSDCDWSGKYSVSSNAKTGRSTLTLSGINCPIGEELNAAFYAKISTPTPFGYCPSFGDEPTAMITGTYGNTKSTPQRYYVDPAPLWVMTPSVSFCASFGG